MGALVGSPRRTTATVFMPDAGTVLPEFWSLFLPVPVPEASPIAPPASSPSAPPGCPNRHPHIQHVVAEPPAPPTAWIPRRVRLARLGTMAPTLPLVLPAHPGRCRRVWRPA